jgi:dienelactone hydrolase
VLIPRAVTPPVRPVIALHGHGTGGASHLIGRIVNATTRDEEEAHIRAHNYDYARQLAQQGFFVVAPEQRGFGVRMESQPELVDGGPLSIWRSSCPAVAFNALLLGKTAIGLRVWDVMCTIDYIRARPEPLVDGIGGLGFSGGAMTALFSAALDPRITVAVLSGCLNTFRASIMASVHCPCQYIPGILQVAEMADIAGLIAPRPLLIESGANDALFPIAAARAAYVELQRVYDLLKVPERLAQDFHPDGHRFSGRRAFGWLATWL